MIHTHSSINRLFFSQLSQFSSRVRLLVNCCCSLSLPQFPKHSIHTVMLSTRKTSRTAPEPNTPRPETSPFSAPTPSPISASIKSVTLDGWWLVKSQGNGLAVEGFALQEAAARIFSSAAISKRHTATVLETIDGITVTVCGLLDISRTGQNGFPPEVYNRYLLGFPFDWEEHADGNLGEGSTEKSAAARNASSQRFTISSQESNASPFSIDDSPATVTPLYNVMSWRFW